MQETVVRIRELNDQFRRGNSSIPGVRLFTSGIQTLVEQQTKYGLSHILGQIRSFDGFSEDNDPHGEHDFGSFEFLGEKLYWKIDYYSPDMVNGSEDPANPLKTVRVLTIMLAAEY